MIYALIYLAIGIAVMVWSLAYYLAGGRVLPEGLTGCVAIIVGVLFWPILLTDFVVKSLAELFVPAAKRRIEKSKAAKEGQTHE